jgi:hypothetical protein
MNKWKVVLISLLGIAGVITLALTIGYLIMGINTPDALAGRALGFTGCYIITLGYFLIFAVDSAILILCLLKWKKKKQKDLSV